MPFDQQAFREAVEARVKDSAKTLGLAEPEAARLQLEVMQATAEVALAFKSLPEETYATETLVYDPITKLVIGRRPFGKVAWELAATGAAGIVMAVIFPGVGGLAAGLAIGAGGYQALKKGLEIVFGGKVYESLTDRDGGLLGALIVLQYDSRVVGKSPGVFPTTAQIREQANRVLKETLHFASDKEAAVRLDELKRQGAIVEKTQDHWDLVESIWVAIR